MPTKVLFFCDVSHIYSLERINSFSEFEYCLPYSIKSKEYWILEKMGGRKEMDQRSENDLHFNKVKFSFFLNFAFLKKNSVLFLIILIIFRFFFAKKYKQNLKLFQFCFCFRNLNPFCFCFLMQSLENFQKFLKTSENSIKNLKLCTTFCNQKKGLFFGTTFWICGILSGLICILIHVNQDGRHYVTKLNNWSLP